jgi:hypothetical protein
MVIRLGNNSSVMKTFLKQTKFLMTITSDIDRVLVHPANVVEFCVHRL